MKFRFANLIPLTALLLSLLGGAMTSTPALAASFSVSTPVELITAINTTNANGVNDVITLGANIVLTAVDNGQNGLPIILTDGGHSLTIEGSGFTLSRDSAAPDFRILQVGPGANVTINDLTVTGGSNAPGAGIHMQTGSTVILDNVEVTGNNNPTNRGGGIYNYYATLTIQNGSVIGRSGAPNTGDGGGGIFAEGTSITTLDASTVSYNTSVNRAGGGFFILSNSQLIIRNGSVVSNNVGGDPGDYPPFTDPAGGGGIHASAGPIITISNSTVSNNTANCVNNPYCGGGGLQGGDSITITNSTFANNTVNCNTSTPCGGGGIQNFATLNITNSSFSANSTTIDGGGIYNHATLNITNSTFSGNAAGAGGGINNQSTLNYSNTIIANSTGGDCLVGTGTVGTNINNLVEDASCNSSLSGDPALSPLANNGGPTQTHALLSSSPAIDAGNAGACPSTDQRSVSRPQGAGCDIGAFEVDTNFPIVNSDSLTATYTSGAGPSNFTVTFNENVYDPAGDTDPDDVTNPANYRIVEDGADNTFNTTSCAGGLGGDDTQATVTSVTYTPNTATVNLSGALPDGTYRLFVCGTTSIVDPALNELNNGLSDYTFDFFVGGAVTASSLPDTGFAPNRITSLPVQPANLAYNNLGDIWIEIPSLNIKTDIVGVPQSSNGWNVDWLGQSAGWLHGTAFPSWEGNSVVTGHVYDANGKMGPFANIKNLKHGDQIIVHLFGEKYIFEVRTSDMVFPSSTKTALEHLEDHSYLTLITCQGYNPFSDSYFFRRVVRAVLVEVQGE